MSINSNNFLEQFENQGFYFSKEMIFNFHNCLITKPFVILSGISGSGKSKLGELYADIINEDDTSTLEIIPVKPNWTDSKGLFGYHNILNNSYYLTPLIKIMIRALTTNDKPHFVILDEMNLAKTEYYFADYLSLLESRRIKKTSPKVDIHNYESIVDNFPLKNLSLSDAIILAAIDINKDEYLKVAEYRNNNFSEAWKIKNSRSDNDNWKAQFRTELNQGPNRQANRFFTTTGNGEYKLKDFNDLLPEDKIIFKNLKHLYDKYTKKEIYFKRKNITLHNNNCCISSNCLNNCEVDSCELSNDMKYTCPRLYDRQNDIYLVPPSMPIPINLFTIGTVNIDETTNMFSPKVLDRSNILEFNNVDFIRYLNLDSTTYSYLNLNCLTNNDNYYFSPNLSLECKLMDLPSKDFSLDFKDKHGEYFDDIIRINSILEPVSFNFGYRVLNEISFYIYNVTNNSTDLNNIKIATDLQILQKILPKIYGNFETLWIPLTKILLVCLEESKDKYNSTNIAYDSYKVSRDTILKNLNSSKYPRTVKKIIFMLDNLANKGFTSYFS
ncbi:MAG: AAA family ATPase [Sarcina ventriculi]|nr:AAA family ATPase [Sarcina ventriculi]MDY7062884.1 AAA family ATPase [Sarcina ventriculi]